MIQYSCKKIVQVLKKIQYILQNTYNKIQYNISKIFKYVYFVYFYIIKKKLYNIIKATLHKYLIYTIIINQKQGVYITLFKLSTTDKYKERKFPLFQFASNK